MCIKNVIKKALYFLLFKMGLKTDRKIIVFESDDWGSVRNSSKENLNEFKKEIDMKFDHYQLYDCLETDKDIIDLKNTLLKHKDKNENPAIFTLNFAMANPDFEKIKKDNYTNFYFKAIDSCYQEKDESKNVLDIVKSGILEKCFLPQLHGREHLNSRFLIESLKDKNSKVFKAFNNKIIGVDEGCYHSLDALNNNENKCYLEDAIKTFKDIFGFESKSFIAPCYVIDSKDKIILAGNGVKFLQGNIFQNLPLDKAIYKKKFVFFGKKDNNLIDIYRNCSFEPTSFFNNNKSIEDCVDSTITEIEKAFKNKKPAIICCHRVNFVSGIDKYNKEFGLKALDLLLNKLKEKFSDIEFMSTVRMCEQLFGGNLE